MFWISLSFLDIDSDLKVLGAEKTLYFGLGFFTPPFLASRNAYRLTKVPTILGVSICIKKIKCQYFACTCTQCTLVLENISFGVLAC